MSYVSVFDILKIGVGPSSSHTLGPWRAGESFIDFLHQENLFYSIDEIHVMLYGSLALTGKGHGTDIACVLGLHGADPESVSIDLVKNYPTEVINTNSLWIGGKRLIDFSFEKNIIFFPGKKLAQHPNGLCFKAFKSGVELASKTYFSVGGGFVVEEEEIGLTKETIKKINYPLDINSAEDLKMHCLNQKIRICDVAYANELFLNDKTFITQRLDKIWKEMVFCIYRGCHTEGSLPGGLHVRRRAHDIYMQLRKDKHPSKDAFIWMDSLKGENPSFTQTLRWISCFAMAVNEENANFSRVVTAPTNGASGVIPSVLAYYLLFSDTNPSMEDIRNFLLTAGTIGGLYKNGATISAAMGGCQAEIGVSSSMSAVALTEALGGTVDQALMAGEIAMEHHLGLTCDPVNGLVQIPCIERNSMGAVKAITAAHLALASNPKHQKVSLDNVIQTMWETAQDMNDKYKETSLGGLATNISVVVPEC